MSQSASSSVARSAAKWAAGDFPKRVGLIAGGGRFPVLFSEEARRLGLEVVCVAIQDHADPPLAESVDKIYWTGIAKLGRMIRILKQEQITCAVMAGKIQKVAMYTPWRFFRFLPDLRSIRFWLNRSRGDNRDDSLLLGIIQEFEKEGIHISSALDLCPSLLVKPGKLTKRVPTSSQLRDIAFGWKLAKQMGDLDVGQSVMIKEQTAIAIEAIEGTDQAILRAGTLCRSGGFTVVKVAKPQQDRRFDMPTIGKTTIESMHKSGGRVLAVEADQTILIDEQETIEMADKLGISIISLTDESAAKAVTDESHPDGAASENSESTCSSQGCEPKFGMAS